MENVFTIIRRMRRSDIKRLVAISRSCFPLVLRWRAPVAHCMRWWEMALESSASETWVSAGTDEGEASGYAIIVKDVPSYELEKKRRQPDYLTRTLMIFLNPHILLINILRSIFLQFSKSTGTTLTPETDLKSGARLWIEPIAVTPRFWGRGIASALIDFIEKKARELNCSHIYLSVERHNRHAIRLYERKSFRCISRYKNQCYYRKMIA